MYFTLPPHITCAFTPPGETGNPTIASFHLNAACFLPKKNTRNKLKYHLDTAEPPFTVKTIDWMHQTGPGILLSVTHKAELGQLLLNCISITKYKLLLWKVIQILFSIILAMDGKIQNTLVQSNLNINYFQSTSTGRISC